MSDKILEALDVKLKEIGNRAKPFGGFSIIFSGDFRQLEPVGSTEFDLLLSSLSSRHWDNCINAIIILDNDHRFKEDLSQLRSNIRLFDYRCLFPIIYDWVSHVKSNIHAPEMN